MPAKHTLVSGDMVIFRSRNFEYHFYFYHTLMNCGSVYMDHERLYHNFKEYYRYMSDMKSLDRLGSNIQAQYLTGDPMDGARVLWDQQVANAMRKKEALYEELHEMKEDIEYLWFN
ncbi:MAG: hypothetical protein Q9225_007663 [Loekoesia sp. 1 TL-2023]